MPEGCRKCHAMYTIINWPNRDPIEEDGGLNLYGMVVNNPVDYRDYLGLSCCGNETLKSGHVCCNGTQYKKQRRKECCGSNYIQTGNNAPCCDGGTPKDRVTYHEKNGQSLDQCIVDNASLSIDQGQLLGPLTSLFKKVLSKTRVELIIKGVPVLGWSVTGITTADWWLARSTCTRKVCP